MSARKDLQARLGYDFRDTSLLETALTHASAGGDVDYERLEFLGDRVVNLIVAERLYALYPNESEGDLSKRHTALVRGETLALAARKLELGAHMVLSPAEKSGGGQDNNNILSDVMEAVMGAVYLDGGLDAARNVLNPLIADDLRTTLAPPRDAKTALQEWTQSKGLGLPEYEVTARSGPDHAPDFTVTVSITGQKSLTASGSSKRAAEKAAAQMMLGQIESKNG